MTTDDSSTPRRRRKLKRKPSPDTIDPTNEFKEELKDTPTTGTYRSIGEPDWEVLTPDESTPTQDGPKIIKVYPKQQCAAEGCTNLAVGSGDICKQHGGDPIIKENLLAVHEMTDIQLAGKYDPAVHPMMYITLSKDGMSDVEIAAEIGVATTTLRAWSEKYLDFYNAAEIGKALYEAWWLKEGRENLDNRGYNTGLYKYMTANKLGYSDKTESKNLHVHAGVLMVPGKLSEKDWEDKVG